MTTTAANASAQIPKLTVPQLLAQTAQKYPQKFAVKYKVGQEWKGYTWQQYQAEIRKIALGLISLGFKSGDGLTIIGFNRPEWFLADLAALYAGGIPAGIYTTNSAEQCQFVAADCKASVAVVEDQEQLQKFLQIRSALPHLKKIVLMSGTSSDSMVVSWAQLAKLGEEASAQTQQDLEQRLKNAKPDEVCTLIYTSGTTGNPKGVMLSHDNMCFTALTIAQTIGAHSDDRIISYLPLSHIAEQIVSLMSPIACGACSYFAESMEKLPDNLPEVRPTLFVGVPRVWEKIQAKMQATGASSPWLRKKLVTWAKAQGLKGCRAEQAGQPVSFGYKLADKIIFSKVRAKLGLDEARICITSAAPISLSTLEFFHSLGVKIFEAFGMSELTGPTTISLPTKYKLGKAGFCLPGMEVKIADDGEILIRGRHVTKGYYNRPEATAETINSQGWLHSGDIGTIDSEGFLQITDRKKDLIITAGGENIAPQILEGKIKSIPVLSQAVVIGDRRKFLTALLTIDPEKLKMAKEVSGSEANNVQELSKCQKFHFYIQNQLEQVNQNLARVQTIKKFAVLPQDFSIEGGELTPTMKVKRKVVSQKYQNTIEALYQ
jgi:long-subunit acyl-CoA synthetase (AMP-forming)